MFVPGFYGLIYAEWYSNVFKQIAAHGYIVVGVDMEYPTIQSLQKDNVHIKQGFDHESKLLKVTDWVSNNK